MIRIEAGELERAAEVALELGTLGEQHGFDSWELAGAAQHATVGALIALADNAGDAAALAPHIATLTAFVDTWRAVGVIALITFYDALLARLLTAAGQLDEARARLQTGLDLADQTTMHFYDAELTGFARSPQTTASCDVLPFVEAIELARSQDARIFELRAATDYFELFGEPAREALTDALSRFPGDSAWPDAMRARALLG